MKCQNKRVILVLWFLGFFTWTRLGPGLWPFLDRHLLNAVADILRKLELAYLDISEGWMTAKEKDNK